MYMLRFSDWCMYCKNRSVEHVSQETIQDDFFSLEKQYFELGLSID